MTISEKPIYKKGELNLTKLIPQNYESSNKKQLISSFKIVIEIQTEIDLIQKQREEKLWKKSQGYYFLNPEKFRFGLRDL